MNRKTKIIISISGICIILFALLGLTYGYYASRFTYNTSEKSVVVKSGSSSVLYTDLSSDEVDEIITPGYTKTKLFTVKNTGKLSATYSIYFTNVINELTRTQDIRYTLYRKSGNNTIDTSDYSDCTKVVDNGQFPTTNAIIVADEILNNSNDYYTYALVVTYINADENQNVDQGKTFNFKVKIYSTTDYFTSPFTSGTLANTIYLNAKNTDESEEANGIAVYRKNPTTTPRTSASNSNEASLSEITDDLGTSYYFRGNVKNNYVNFAGMCWRIVRIEGDGAVKIILQDQSATCDSSSYTGNYVTDEIAFDGGSDCWGVYAHSCIEDANDGGIFYSLKNYQTTTLSSKLSNGKTLSDYLKNDEWCYDDSKLYELYYCIDNDSSEDVTRNDGCLSNEYESFHEVSYGSNNTDLKCNGTKLTKFSDNTIMYVATLTADELVYAGNYDSDYSDYLQDDYFSDWWTISPGYNGASNEFYVSTYSSYSISYIENYVRPAVVLKSSITATGSGTKTSPYIVG